MGKIKKGWEEYAKRDPELYRVHMKREAQLDQLRKKGDRMRTSSLFKATTNKEAKEYAGAARLREKWGDNQSGQSWERGDNYYGALKNFMQAGRPEDAIRCEEKYLKNAPGGIESIYGDSKKADVKKVTEHAKFLEKYNRPDLAARYYALIGDEGNYERASNAAKNRDNSQTRQDHIKSKLEKAAIAASIVGIIGGLFFLSSNITGNAIANISVQNSSFLGAGLLIVGLVAGWFWLKGKK